MKIVNLLLALMFVVFAYLQLNDPDPIVWILIYGAMAVICVLAAFNIRPRIVMIIMLVIFVGYSFVYFDGLKEWFGQPDKSVLFDDVMKMQHPYIEESREFLGLMICVAILAVHILLSLKRSTSR
jgi:hypothetical protein